MPPRFIAFGKALAIARQEAGIPTQAGLARATDLTPVEANRYERGTHLPTLTRFAHMTRTAGLDPVPLLAALDPEPDTTDPQGGSSA